MAKPTKGKGKAQAKGPREPRRKPRSTTKPERLRPTERAALEDAGVLPDKGVATAEDLAQLRPQRHGGKLLPGGVKGNRGAAIANMRRKARRQLLAMAFGDDGALELLRAHIKGVVIRDVPDGEDPTKTKRIVTVLDEDQRRAAVRDVLHYSLGPISSQSILNENDESLEAGVVVLPMLDPAPVAPTSDPANVAPAVDTRRAAAQAAVQALLRAAT